MEGIDLPKFDDYEGRAAGRMRSDYLDQMAARMDRYLSRHHSGLDPNIIAKRTEIEKDFRDAKFHGRRMGGLALAFPARI